MSDRKTLYFSDIPVLVLAITTGIIFSIFQINTIFFGFKEGAFIATLYAQSDLPSSPPEELQLQAKDYLSALMELQNQSNTNESLLEDESIDNTSTNGTDLETQQLATDVKWTLF